MADFHEAKRPRRLIKFPEVKQAVALGKTSIYGLIKRGEFPAPLKLCASGRSVAWVEEDVARWVEGRVKAAQGGGQ